MTAWNLTTSFALWALLGVATGGELYAQQTAAPLRSAESLFPQSMSAGSAPLELAFAEPNDKAAETQKPAAKAKRIELPKWSTGTKADAWDDYFRRNEAPQNEVRETVRALVAEKKHDEVIGLIEGAIRQKQAQPWMYEALGIAMQVSGRPAVDIERVMMSAIDFSRGPQDLIRVAYYLSHWMPDDRALAQRALKLYRQATEQAPLEAEIFTHALELAKRWDDLDAIEWSCEGILRFPWPHSQRHIPEHADQVATTKLRELLKAAEVDRAAEFKRRIDAARTRDCVIRVSWIGTADIDLLVEDPAGSLCSFSNPRSAGGGVLLRDNQTATDERDQTTKFEEYVCAEGLSGIYRMQIRRVWGKVNGDKVSIDFWTQRGTREERRQRQVIELKDGEAVVNFQLQGGRRESVDADPRIASTVGYQLAIGKAILAQQFGLPSSAIRGDQLPVSTTPTRNLQGARAGYQPLIITLPTGANMSAIAVVSSDRRYVRITPQPLFSSVPNVNIYNFANGSVSSVPGPISVSTPISPGTPGACAAAFNVNGCADTPPVSGYVILFHPNRFQGAGGCSTVASPNITNVDQLVDTTPFNLGNYNPPLAGANLTRPGPGSVHYNSLPQYTVLNGFPAARFDAQAYLATRTSLLVNNAASGLTGMHFFMLGAAPAQTDNFNWDVIADYAQGQPAGGLPATTVTPGGFTIFYDNRLWAGVHTRTRHELTVTDRNLGLPRDRNVNSLMNAVSTNAGVFYYGRTNSQDDHGATRALNGMDMFDFGFSSSTRPNGNANTAIPFMHIPQPVPFDPLLPNFIDWGPYVTNDPFTYRFYKSNAAWDAYGTLPPDPPNLLGYKVPNLRDVTVPDPATALLLGGKPVPGTGQGYWPQNEANRTPVITPPVALANPIPDPLPPVDTLGYFNLYDEWFPIPDPAFSPDPNDTRGPQRNPGTYRPAAGPLSNIPDRQSRRFALGAAVNTFGHRRQDTDPSGVLRVYTHRASDLFISIAVLYPRVLTYDEANRVATWMNCWGGAVNYDRSTSPGRNPSVNVIDDNRRRQIQQWPYTIP